MPADLRRLSVNFYGAPPECRLDEFCAVLARRGIGGIGLTASAIDQATPETLARLLRQHELQASSLNSAGYFLHADPVPAAAQRDLDDRLLDLSAVLNAPVNVIPGGMAQARGMDGKSAPPLPVLRERVRDGLAILAARARRRGATLSLEAIHPMGIDRGCINQLSAARALIAPLPGTGLTLDFFHSWWDADLADLVLNDTPLLSIVQISGVALHRDGMPRRVQLQDDEAGIAGLLGLLDRADYRGMLEHVVFYGSGAAGDAASVIDDAAESFLHLRSGPDL